MALFSPGGSWSQILGSIVLEYSLFSCNYGQLKKSLQLRKEGKDMYLLGSVVVTSEWFFCKEELLQQSFSIAKHSKSKMR